MKDEIEGVPSPKRAASELQRAADPAVTEAATFLKFVLFTSRSNHGSNCSRQIIWSDSRNCNVCSVNAFVVLD